jgi:hypothetical protein
MLEHTGMAKEVPAFLRAEIGNNATRRFCLRSSRAHEPYAEFFLDRSVSDLHGFIGERINNQASKFWPDGRGSEFHAIRQHATCASRLLPA